MVRPNKCLQADWPRILSFAILLVTAVGCHRLNPPVSALAGDWTLIALPRAIRFPAIRFASG